jgi:hypothetical protein
MTEWLQRVDPEELVGAITFIILIVAAMIGIPASVIYWDLRKRRLEAEERRSFIEKGMTPPPSPVKTPEETMAMWGMYTTKMQRQRLQFEERRLMIEKGMTPPPFLPGSSPDRYRRNGFVMASLGLGLSVAYFALDPENSFKGLVGFAGPILAFLGIGLIVYSSQTKEAPRN